MTKSIFFLKVWVVGCEEAARGRQLLSARGLPAEQSRAASRSHIFAATADWQREHNLSGRGRLVGTSQEWRARAIM